MSTYATRYIEHVYKASFSTEYYCTCLVMIECINLFIVVMLIALEQFFSKQHNLI